MLRPGVGNDPLPVEFRAGVELHQRGAGDCAREKIAWMRKEKVMRRLFHHQTYLVVFEKLNRADDIVVFLVGVGEGAGV